LVRYKVPFRGFWDALVDLPFALPSSSCGHFSDLVYGPHGWIGSVLESYGFKVVFTPIGITIAMIFVSFPFAVRTIEPVLKDLDPEVEECARVWAHHAGEYFKNNFTITFFLFVNRFYIKFCSGNG
jgi:sulfate transport system permease protein